ncbi:PAAR domain-containing protein [Vreelandella alkaliphila]|uniref:PAAR domain-containing protein n=1 Tax=Vreelandella alkaliphila TaxID=272774 RepID=A0AAJ2S4L8_9GAMM|nr:PAAR domain-containing protein [Halomonas alkaliphila]MDX5979643.1 PAAR domain-containing protein [Halomonas alkaliphila]
MPHCGSSTCHGGTSVSGSGSVFVNGRAITRVSDAVDCGSTAATGSPNVFAN